MGAKRNRKPSLVVASQARKFVRARKCFAGSDLLAGLEESVGQLLARAVERARLNKRKTVRRRDL